MIFLKYEQVEDMIAKKVAECISKKLTLLCDYFFDLKTGIDSNYTVDLPPNLREELIACAEKIPVAVLALTLRRFIFR